MDNQQISTQFTDEYFTDVIDLFINFKDIADSYGSTIFNKKCNADELLEFLDKNVYINNIERESKLFDDDLLVDVFEQSK